MNARVYVNLPEGTYRPRLGILGGQWDLWMSAAEVCGDDIRRPNKKNGAEVRMALPIHDVSSNNG